MKHDLMVKDIALLQVIEDRSIGELIKPLVNEIHLFDTYISGTTRVKNKEVYASLHVGDKLILQKENSKFEDNGILVLNEKKELLGYIPEKDNQIFSRLMDAGKLLVGKVDSLSYSEYFQKIHIGIYLVDY